MKKIKTLFYEIDEILNSNNGEGKLIALGSRPGMGKTTLLLNILQSTMLINYIDVLIFSIELSKSNVIERLSKAQPLTPDKLEKIHIDETSSPSIDYIEKIISEHNNPKVIFLDYIELVNDYTKGHQADILSRLKKICKEMGVHIIYTRQLPRSLEERIDKRPITKDIDEITLKTVDAMFALYRPAYYTGDDPIAELRALKHPSGELLEIPLFFDDKQLSFYYDIQFSLDEAPVKRVELSVHTKMSDDVSAISVQEALDFADSCNHKAIAFTNYNNVQDFPEIRNLSAKYDNLKVIYGARLLYENDEGGAWVTTLLIKNQQGVKNLYKLISSMTEMGNTKIAHINSIEQYREHLLRSACGDLSELYCAFQAELPMDEIKAIAQRYDYIEIFPTNDIITRTIYQKIVELGKDLNIPVVATGDCHYYSKDDEICRRIVKHFRGGAEDNDQQYLRNTNDMLKAFAYLGDDAYDVVVTNSNLIADIIEKVYPIAEAYPLLNIPDADKYIYVESSTMLSSIYGTNPPDIISKRYKAEMDRIINNGYASIYMLSHLITKFSHNNGFPTCSRGSVGSSFIAFLLGITNVNPLQPHYYCENCKHIEFINDNSVYSGDDLPQKHCPVCGQRLNSDGHNIPYETFMGLNGDKVADIDLNFSESFHDDALNYLCDMFGEERILRAGTISSLVEKISDMYVKMYEEVTGVEFDYEHSEIIKYKIDNIKRKEGVHPCGVFIIPEGTEICDFTPINTIETNDKIKKCSHFSFHALHDCIYKADILGFIPLEILYRLQKLTGTSQQDIDFNDPKLYELFKDSRSIGINSDEPATLGIPEFETEFVRNMIKQIKPKCFGDLVKISGLSHGTAVWLNNAEELLKNNICEFKDLAASRDDVYNYLKSCGFKRHIAYKVSEAVRKGIFERRGINKEPEIVEEFKSHNIPDWYMESLCKIRYMFPKAHSVEYVKTALTLAWYKIYYPTEFYAVTFNVRFPDRDYSFLCGGLEAINKYIEDCNLPFGSEKEDSIDRELNLFKECAERGIVFECNTNKENCTEPYSVSNGKILLNY